MILPHPQVLGYMRKKTENYDRWIAAWPRSRRRCGKLTGSSELVMSGGVPSIHDPGVAQVDVDAAQARP